MVEAPQLGAFPRLGRGVKALLVLYAVFGLGGAILTNYAQGLGLTFWTLLPVIPGAVLTHPWTLLTGGLLTDPEHWSHLIFTGIGFYFLGPDLERRWGTWRFLRFIALAILAGFGLQLMLGAIAPGDTGVFHRHLMFGPAAALAALGVAWGRENAQAQIRLYFFLPVSGRSLVWITLGFCVLGLFFPASATEGVAAPFGGFIVGLLLAGSPSAVRELYLRAKLAMLRRQGKTVHVDLDPRAPLKVSKKRSGPPLRVVVGGVEDLEKRRPPKDKRYLN
jgi:membrane associated rhomboid family serine protease